ncbi:hypothetical protein FBQ82_14925 [Anaerolineae bacterium CFX7]|nr:hypothetical protein [Anaerolineae bacterium CFX7]
MNGGRPTRPVHARNQTRCAKGKYKILVGWYDAGDPTFARLHVFDTEGKDVGDFVALSQQVLVK